MNLIQQNVNNLIEFIIARHAIYVARQEGKPKPWTEDPILRQYRFCNVYRELDTVTQWVAENWRDPHPLEKDLWFAMAVARWVNWPDTLAEIGVENALSWKPKHFVKVLHDRRDRGEKVWTGAYMIGTQGNAMDKAEFIATGVLQPLWDNRAKLRPKVHDTLSTFANRVIAVKNQGSFMVGQMVADTKYADPILKAATDWNTWAVSGPGSRRGLNRVLGRDLQAGWPKTSFLDWLTQLRQEVNNALPPWMEELHAQDLQNCLCEFDKYERVRLGQGKPRSRYPGGG